MTRLLLTAPFAGWCTPLAQVPDPVFAQAMAGDGVAIDPIEGILRAPCDGELLPMRDAKHAITLRSEAGVEILVHVGIDTVELAGRGFERVVEPGRRVAAGDVLVRFDLDVLAREARSLVSPVVVASGGRVMRRASAGRIAAGEFLLEIEPTATQARSAPSQPAITQARASCTFIVPFDHGLHARPAAQLAAALRPFASDVRLVLRGREANARSTVSMMALGARAGDAIEAHATGDDAGAALAALERLLSPGDAPRGRTPKADPAAVRPGGASPSRIEGVIASRGLAMGPCAKWERPEIAVMERGQGEETERVALTNAIATLCVHLESLHAASEGEAQALVAAHIELARDPDLHARALDRVRMGEGAGYAWRRATRATAAMLSALDDARMRERAADLMDLEHQLLRVLAGEPPGAAHAIPAGSIVVAEDLLPSQMMALQRAGVLGVCTARGGATSHMAILAAAAGVPALVAAGDAVMSIDQGTRLILDAEQGFVEVDPPAARAAATQAAIDERRTQRANDLAAALEPAITRDGVRIPVLANLGSSSETAAAVQDGAEGCGLLRTEFLYLDRREAPDEEEQRREYQRIADGLGGRTLTIRTMDIGGDKPIAFMPCDREENPALGLRGVRASLEHPHLLRAQLAAILRVTPPNACRVLVPMVTDASDIRAVRAMLDEERARLKVMRAPAIGAMIETPASALLADSLAAECDFLSIGTNDLAQYTLAIDRAHPRLASRLDALHPAVLQLIARVAEAARARGKTVSVCGALGSDVEALPILIGLGVQEISATPAMIPRLKSVVRTLDTSRCREIARKALAQPSGAAVRKLAAAALVPATTLTPGA